MPRPKRYRRMNYPPRMRGYKPFGTPARNLQSVTLFYEEYEALRLADYDLLNQKEAAKKMEVSRPTFTRIYDKARKKMAEAFVEGKVLLIEGGQVKFEASWFRCEACHEIFQSEPGGYPDKCPYCHSEKISHINASFDEIAPKSAMEYCVCPSCGYKELHKPGEPCRDQKCMKCNTNMHKENF